MIKNAAACPISWGASVVGRRFGGATVRTTMAENAPHAATRQSFLATIALCPAHLDRRRCQNLAAPRQPHLLADSSEVPSTQ